MRATLYQYLTANCESIKTWKQPYTATKDDQKPFGVIVLGEEVRSVNRLGYFRDLVIWPYFSVGSFVLVDKAVAELKRLLSDVVLTTAIGSKFEIEWVHTGKDFRDDDLHALTRRIEFRIPQVGK